MEILRNALGFIAAIGVLVAFHEFGHYWVARCLGVKVLRYSIGFGKPLLSWRRGRDNIEYVIAAIPLGGYVKMLDEREGGVAPEEVHRAFNRQSLSVRTAIVAAGPVFNLIFAVLAYWLVFVTGAQELRPVLGAPVADTPAAAAGFRNGDEVVAVDGQRVETWDQVLVALLSAGVDRAQIGVRVQTDAGETAERTLDFSGVRALGDDPNFLGVVGLQPWSPPIPPVVGEVVPDSAAAKAGLRAGDRIIALDGQPVEEWSPVAHFLRERPGQTVTLSVRRDEGVIDLSATVGSQEVQGQVRGLLGVAPAIPDNAEALYQSMFREVRYGPGAALARAATDTWKTSWVTVKVLWRMITGEASIKNLSGPLNIAQFAGESVKHGLAPFLKFLALISVSLAVLNLLPVPVLDGGHLLYYAIEAIRGRPLSERAQMIGQQIGIAMLVLLMSVAFYNDITRLLVR